MSRITYDHTGSGRPITRADSVRHAAEIIARREYGRRGVVGALRHDAAGPGVSIFEVFIGRPVRGDARTMTGRNVWIYARGEG